MVDSADPGAMYSGPHNGLPGVVDSADPGAVYDGEPGGM